MIEGNDDGVSEILSRHVSQTVNPRLWLDETPFIGRRRNSTQFSTEATR